MILIVAIALLPVLSACIARIRPNCNCPTTTVLEPVVTAWGTLDNLKLKYGKEKRLFKKPIQEGFYVRYRIDGGEAQTFYAIGNQISDPNAKYSGYLEKITGAGITSEKKLHVTSSFFFDRRFGTLVVTRTFVNSSDKGTMYLSEIRNYGGAILRPLGLVAGKPTEVKEVPRAPVAPGEVKPSPTVTGEAKPVFSLLPQKDKGEDQKLTENCWPCLPLPDCTLDPASLERDPDKATIVCVDCNGDIPVLVHTVCLDKLEDELAEYRRKGCEYSVTFTGVRDARSKDTCDHPLESVLARYPSEEAPGEPGRAPSEWTLEGLLALRPTETSQGPSDEKLGKLLTLPPKAAVAIITEYKINTSW
jgi:hypothetical protein